MGSQKANIVEQITSGFIKIDSIAEFEELLTDFPKDPALHKAYAELLLENDSPAKAALAYGKAAAFYLKSQKLLLAVDAKLLQWRIHPPVYDDAQLFLTALNDNSLPDTPLLVFFKKLSKPELLAVIKCIESVQLPAGQLIYKIDDVQQDLYFIVSGQVKKLRYQPVKTDEETVFKQSIDFLSADDTFGRLSPIEKDNLSQSFVEITEPTELLKISKQKLLPICKKYPNIESGLQALSHFRTEFRKTKLLEKNRKGQRHDIMRKMSLEIFPHASANFPIILDAYSKDISIGGTCVVLDANDLSVAKSVASFSKTIKDSMVKISLPSEGMELKVSGKIAWTRETLFKGEKTLAVGIQFQDLSPKLRGMLFVFADDSKNKID
jgi:CRP-like cAMP-binding protein